VNIKIGSRTIGSSYPSFIIAEGGINHNGNIKIAKKIIGKAKECGVDAIKFQTFKADDLTSQNSIYYNLFKKLELTESDFSELSKYSKMKGLIFLSTPFSNQAVDILTKINVPAFKISSGDLTNIPLLKYAASKKKPMIISTGMANNKEIDTAISAIKKSGNNKIIILHSVSSYPTPVEEENLLSLQALNKKYPYPVGFSDNGDNLLVPVVATSLGAKLIEKHFTINKNLRGPDHKISANPAEMKNLVKNIRSVEKMLGKGIKKCQKSEKKNLINARRSITAIVDIPLGTKIEESMIGLKRPAHGIEPKFIEKIIGKITKMKIRADQTIRWNDIR